MEILPSKRFESYSQSENGLKRPFGVKNDRYGPCHGADFYENDTLSRSRNPENDTLFSGTSPYGKIYEYLPPESRSYCSTLTLKIFLKHKHCGEFFFVACKDLNTNCPSWKKYCIATSIYWPFMSKNCKQTCDLCTGIFNSSFFCSLYSIPM